MIDTDRLELIDTGDGVPLTKCEQNLYEALANVEDGIVVTRTKTRLEDALADMSELVAEVRRLREAFVIAVRHVGYHHSQDDLWYALRKRGMDDLYDDDEDFGEWEE